MPVRFRLRRKPRHLHAQIGDLRLQRSEPSILRGDPGCVILLCASQLRAEKRDERRRRLLLACGRFLRLIRLHIPEIFQPQEIIDLFNVVASIQQLLSTPEHCDILRREPTPSAGPFWRCVCAEVLSKFTRPSADGRL